MRQAGLKYLLFLNKIVLFPRNHKESGDFHENCRENVTSCVFVGTKLNIYKETTYHG
jgi:hypothetical protein